LDLAVHFSFASHLYFFVNIHKESE